MSVPEPPPGRPRALEIDGLRLNLIDHGRDDDPLPPLLLLHGGMAHARWWDLVAPALADVVHPVALDRRGHGDSDWAEDGSYGWERDLLDVEEVMRRTSAHGWTVAGHSQGGLLAVHLAARGNVPIRRVILLDVPLEPASPRLQRAGRAFNRIPQLRYPTLEHAVRRFQPFPTPHRIAPALLAYLARHSFKPVPDGDGGYTSKFHWKSYQRDRSREGNPVAAHGERLRALRMPVASVHAAESTILSHADQQELLARLPDGHGFEIATATHSLHAEQPAAVTAALRTFLARS